MLKIFNFCQIPLPSLVNVNVYCLAWAHRVKSVLNPYCSMIKYKKVGNKACKKSRLLIILKVIEMKVATIEQCISLRKKKIKLRKLVHSQLEQRELCIFKSFKTSQTDHVMRNHALGVTDRS